MLETASSMCIFLVSFNYWKIQRCPEIVASKKFARRNRGAVVMKLIREKIVIMRVKQNFCAT